MCLLFTDLIKSPDWVTPLDEGDRCLNLDNIDEWET